MPDYEQELRFGIFPSPEASRLDDTLGLVQLAEVEGLDLVSVQDHPYQAKYLDTWTLLSVLGARTSTITLAPNVASLPLRPPVVLAKVGGHARPGHGRPGRARARCRRVLGRHRRRRRPASYAGRGGRRARRGGRSWSRRSGPAARCASRASTTASVGLHAGPRPAHDIPVWLGAYKPRMLRLTGRLADGWVPSMGYADPSDAPRDVGGRRRGGARRRPVAGRGDADLQRVRPVRHRQRLPPRASPRLGRAARRPHARRRHEQLRPRHRRPRRRTRLRRPRSRRPCASWSTPSAIAARRARRGARATPVAPEAAPTREALAVTPTPDDGRRISRAMPWDEETRPTHRSRRARRTTRRSRPTPSTSSTSTTGCAPSWPRCATCSTRYAAATSRSARRGRSSTP